MSKKIPEFIERKINIVDSKTKLALIKNKNIIGNEYIILPDETKKNMDKGFDTSKINIGWKFENLNSFIRTKMPKIFKLEKNKRYSVELLLDEGWTPFGDKFSATGERIENFVNFDTYVYRSNVEVDNSDKNVYAICFIELN